MDNNYKQFVNKLDSYIRKFYFYQLIRGIILFILVLISYFSCISTLEYFNYFDPKVKLIIVLITIVIVFFISVYFLFIPLIKLLGIGKRLTYSHVSSLLNRSFPGIKDKLINIVELANDSNSFYSSELTKASIDQKIDELKIFRFSDAIRFRDLKMVVIILVSVLVAFFIGYLYSPSFFKDTSIRLVHFQQKFERPAPFTFKLENYDLEIITGQSIELRVRCSGKAIPDMLYVSVSGNSFLMKKDADLFTYTVENVNSSLSVYFTDQKYVSEVYKIHVLNKPFISSFTVEIQSPGYTGLGTEKLQNIGDLKLISGSSVKWIFHTVDTDSLFLIFNDSIKALSKKNDNSFEILKSIYNDCDYRVALKNSRLQDDNSMVYKIKTISDLFPEIKVVQIRDSLDFKVFHFKGTIVDDFGFSQLNFNVNANGKDTVFSVPFTPFLLNQNFYYSFDFESIKNFSKSFKYYFSVSDNDFINHYKRAISETFTFSFPDYQEIISKENSDLSSLDKLFDKSSKLVDDIKNDFESFKRKQINSELTEWEKFQSVKKIMNKKTELENVLNKINKQNKDANNFQNSFSDEKTDLLKKQEKIEELLNEVFTDELKKLFQEFNDLAKQFDSKKFDQLSKEMNSKMDDLSKQLDKNLQVLKRMKVEQKVERLIAELKKLLVSEQIILKNLETTKDIKPVFELENENFLLLKNLHSDYQSTLDLNKTLDKPLNLINFDSEFESLKAGYTKILVDAEKGNKRKTGSGIEYVIKGIDQLVFAMDQMLKNNKKKESEANIDDMKQLLENLILVSFDQESILKKSMFLNYNDPLINSLKVNQKNLNKQVEFVGDSLYALSKRVPDIGAVINKEMEVLKANSERSYDNLESGNLGGSRMYQQYGITAANNLALFISELLESSKNQQQSGDGDCEKPGGKGSKPGMKKLKDNQSSIKEQLQKMIDQMKKGSGNMSKSIGQTLAQQEIMQQLIREMVNSGTVGSKSKEQLKAIDQLLEQSNKDLINRSISSELVNRQNMILSKLLDAEKSEIERDFEDKRESKTGVDTKKDSPVNYFEFNNSQKPVKDDIKRSNFQLRSFYDQKYNRFMNQIKN